MTNLGLIKNIAFYLSLWADCSIFAVKIKYFVTDEKDYCHSHYLQ